MIFLFYFFLFCFCCCLAFFLFCFVLLLLLYCRLFFVSCVVCFLLRVSWTVLLLYSVHCAYSSGISFYSKMWCGENFTYSTRLHTYVCSIVYYHTRYVSDDGNWPWCMSEVFIACCLYAFSVPILSHLFAR